MIENGLLFNLAAGLLSLAEPILQGYCLARLVKPFMERTAKVRLVWAVYSLAMLLLIAMNCHLGATVSVMIGISAALLAMCRTDPRNYEQKLFLAAAFFSLCWLAYAITEILYDNLYSYATHTDFMVKSPDYLWEALFAAMCIFYLVSEITILLASIWCVKKIYTYKSANMTKKELCILLAPLFTGAVGFEIIQYYRSFYICEIGKSTEAYDTWALIYYAVSIAVVVVVIGLYQSIKANQEEILQNELLAAQIDSIRHHIGQVECLYQNIRGIRHDMANHIMTLERLYASDQTEEAKKYTTALKTALVEVAGEIRSGNPVTDVILQEWKQEAEKRQILFSCDFYYPAGSDINVFDVSVILNNALQNAVEHTAKNASVSIRSYCRNNAYMIEAVNSFTGNLQWDSDSGLPVTSKTNAEGHGYGLVNIRRVAGKYAGDIAIDIKDGKFCLSVMLMMDMKL
ncbi:MAG: GHKL domain-containing protein [Lachnospiraceae bacterium]|nr:GHKL domain-containing protein [Lachnospiraceae bacterium]